MLLTSSLDSTSLPVPGTRRRLKLKLLALLSFPLPTPNTSPPCFPGKPVGPVGGRRNQSQGLLPCQAPHLQPPTPHKGTCLLSQLQSLSRHDLISLCPAGREKSESSSHFTDRKTESQKGSRLHPGSFSMAEPEPEPRKSHSHLWVPIRQRVRVCELCQSYFLFPGKATFFLPELAA